MINAREAWKSARILALMVCMHINLLVDFAVNLRPVISAESLRAYQCVLKTSRRKSRLLLCLNYMVNHAGDTIEKANGGRPYSTTYPLRLCSCLFSNPHNPQITASFVS